MNQKTARMNGIEVIQLLPAPKGLKATITEKDGSTVKAACVLLALVTSEDAGEKDTESGIERYYMSSGVDTHRITGVYLSKDSGFQLGHSIGSEEFEWS